MVPFHEEEERCAHGCLQRESTASIVDAPGKYVQESPPKPQRLVRIDCRGLEFVEFKPDVWVFFFFFGFANRVLFGLTSRIGW